MSTRRKPFRRSRLLAPSPIPWVEALPILGRKKKCIQIDIGELIEISEIRRASKESILLLLNFRVHDLELIPIMRTAFKWVVIDFCNEKQPSLYSQLEERFSEFDETYFLIVPKSTIELKSSFSDTVKAHVGVWSDRVLMAGRTSGGAHVYIPDDTLGATSIWSPRGPHAAWCEVFGVISSLSAGNSSETLSNFDMHLRIWSPIYRRITDAVARHGGFSRAGHKLLGRLRR